MDWDPVYKSNYENTAFSPWPWINSARCLLASAKVLEPKVLELWENMKNQPFKRLPVNYTGPYFMLIAFAVENYFKAAIVKKKYLDFKKEFRENKKQKFPKDLNSHKLINLAKKAGFILSKGEEGLLRRLTRHAIWAGRYPIPTDYSKSTISELFSDGTEHAVSYYGGDDVERLNILLKDIEERLEFWK